MTTMYIRAGRGYQESADWTQAAQLGNAILEQLTLLGLDTPEAIGAMAEDNSDDDRQMWKAIAEAMRGDTECEPC
jgi:hypothetical protein